MLLVEKGSIYASLLGLFLHSGDSAARHTPGHDHSSGDGGCSPFLAHAAVGQNE